jgi:hypothetical protein
MIEQILSPFFFVAQLLLSTIEPSGASLTCQPGSRIWSRIESARSQSFNSHASRRFFKREITSSGMDPFSGITLSLVWIFRLCLIACSQVVIGIPNPLSWISSRPIPIFLHKK